MRATLKRNYQLMPALKMLIQRFGGALNLNVHFHLLVLDGVYRRDGEGRLVFVHVPSPSTEGLKGDRETTPSDP